MTLRETPEQKFRRIERDKKFALLTRQERSIRLMKSWSDEFWTLKERDNRDFVVFTFFLALNTFLLILVVT